MSPKATKHTTHPAKSTAKRAVPIVNVFDEEPAQATVQPARRPVVVEIEDVPTQMPEPTPPSMPQPEVQPQRVWQSQAPQPIVDSQPEQTMAPLPADVANVTPVEMPTRPVPQSIPSPAGMNAEPALPSFFEHDLKNGMNQVSAPMPAPGSDMPSPGAPTMFTDSVAASPQAVVGEINEAASGEGGGSKKMIGIILMVLAILILAIGGLFLYAKNLFSPTTVPTPTPEVIATPLPTPIMTATPAASASATPLPASESAALKKKVKVDVLNGTKTAGLAAKEAAILKDAGFVMGTVGNGKPENAGTIVTAPANKPLVAEIQSLLKDFTFKVTEDAKMTTIQVTLGEK